MFFHEPYGIVREPSRPNVLSNFAGFHVEWQIETTSVWRVAGAHADNVQSGVKIPVLLFLGPKSFHKPHRIAPDRAKSLCKIGNVAQLKIRISACRANESENLRVPHPHN